MKTKLQKCLLAAVLGTSLLSGCAPLVVGGAVVGGMVAVDRRTSGTQLEDENIELKVASAVNKELGERVHLNVTSYNRRVLLSGEVRTEADRSRATLLAQSQENVREVINDLALGAPSSISQRTKDAVTTGQIKASFVDAKDLQSNAVKVVTERGVVFSVTATNADPVIGGTGVTKVAADTAGTGTFTKDVTGLTPDAGHSFKAYATNEFGTSYSSVATLQTLSATATLSALSLSIGTLSPAFTSGVLNYTASVAASSSPITVTPTSTHPQATIQVALNGGAWQTVTSGSPSNGLTLSSGANTVAVRVTAQDGATRVTYTISVTRRAVPTVTSQTSSAVWSTRATLGGNVTADGGASVTERGVVFSRTSANSSPTIGGTGVTKVMADTAGTGVFTKQVTGLTGGITFPYLRHQQRRHHLQLRRHLLHTRAVLPDPGVARPALRKQGEPGQRPQCELPRRRRRAEPGQIRPPTRPLPALRPPSAPAAVDRIRRQPPGRPFLPPRSRPQ